jgi:ABC-type branched-subunit amino acid transport system ATPase component/ABC-type branched-subunit amino acid transport system permease subunit
VNLVGVEPFGLAIPLPVVALGVIVGITYGLLSVGLLLVYRSNRIVNFAHGEMGAFGAAIFGLLAVGHGVPYYLALPVGVLAGAGAGAASEVAVVRRLRRAPRLMSVVATLGVGQFLLIFSLVVFSQANAGSVFPQPPGLPEFRLGALLVTRSYSGMLLAGPVIVAALALFLRRSRYGLAIRAAAANPEAARMSGIFASRMSSLAWAIAGAISAMSAILVAPTQAVATGTSIGPGLLLRAMVGAVLARMNSFPRALAAGIGLGVIEQVLLWNYPRGGPVEMVMFVLIVAAFLVQKTMAGRDEEKGSWAAVQAWRPLPEALRAVWVVRHLSTFAWAAAAVAAVVMGLLLTNSAAITMVGIIAFAMVGLSVGVVTGLGGQLSLGQFAFGAIGAVVSFQVTSRIGSFPLGLLYAGLAAGLVSVLVGLPALRARGLLVTITTLSFAVVTPAWLLLQSWLLGDGTDPGRPIVGDTPLDTGRRYYWFALAVLVVALILARNIRRGGFGRLLVALRDNEANARAFTIPATLVKIEGLLASGFIAGVGGAVYGHSLSQIGANTFPVTASIDVAVITVIGGMSVLAGPLVGAAVVLGVPAFLPLDAAGLAATKLGLLLLILYFPGGVTQNLQGTRDRLARRLAARFGVTVQEAEAAAPAGVRLEALTRRHEARPVLRLPGTPLLAAVDLRKHFGGITAVDGVSFEVAAGETLGLIGPNGAGKTTLFELLGGFTKPDSGRVAFDGRDITHLGPEHRARLGLIRSFQDAALFPTLSVLDCVTLSLERRTPTSFVGSALGLRGRDRAKQAEARDLVDLMGLGAFRHKPVSELSTGTRRIAEIACLVGLQPTLLLLDEPASGVAQRETEALGLLLAELKRELGLTLLVIEHDIPLIMSISDRILAMDSGRVIADGPPEAVRHDPLVVESYLGGSIEAIERSGVARGPVLDGAASG